MLRVDQISRISGRFLAVLAYSPQKPSRRSARMRWTPKWTWRCWNDRRKSPGDVSEVASWICNVPPSTATFPVRGNRNRDRSSRRSSTSGEYWMSSCSPPFRRSTDIDNDMTKKGTLISIFLSPSFSRISQRRYASDYIYLVEHTRVKCREQNCARHRRRAAKFTSSPLHHFSHSRIPVDDGIHLIILHFLSGLFRSPKAFRNDGRHSRRFSQTNLNRPEVLHRSSYILRSRTKWMIANGGKLHAP